MSPAGQYPTLVRRLQEALHSQLGEALRCVLLVDEAHDIPQEVFPVFRLLTNCYEVGAFRCHGFLKDCVGIRLHDPAGHPLGYMGRRLRQEDIATWGKYKVPSGLPTGSLIYGWHRLVHPKVRTLIVTECAWAVLRLAALELPAVALLGCHASSRQQAMLRTVPGLTLLLDGDPAGRQGARRLAEQLSPDCRVHIAALPDGLDPDELDDVELRNTVSPA